jgi:hypothetical protein
MPNRKWGKFNDKPDFKGYALNPDRPVLGRRRPLVDKKKADPNRLSCKQRV